MILELSVENLAILERAHVQFGRGFSAMTGETGAGKSLLIDALNLALGERADSDLVRNGADKLSVNLVFEVGDRPEIQSVCEEQGFSLEDGRLYVQREVTAEGRSTCRVGGKMVPVGGLKAVGGLLVDLHGQHDHQSLLDSAKHLGFLDAWIGSPAHNLRAEVAAAVVERDRLQSKLRELRSLAREREKRLDMLQFQVNEIESVGIQPGELAELESQLSRLKHSEKIAEGTAAALAALDLGEPSARDLLALAAKQLATVVRFDDSLTEIYEQIEALSVGASEAIHTLATYADRLESDPSQLDEIQSRIDHIKRLLKKYGETEEEVLEFFAECKAQLSLLESPENQEEVLVRELDKAKAHVNEIAAQLTSVRSDAAPRFAQIVEAQLRDLSLEKAVFQVGLEPQEPDSSGGDRVEFLFCANPGEPIRALARIASGGEMSRVMLAIKTALAGVAGVPVLIFDEVDTGLSGRAAATMAKKLAELGQNYQVIVISHLPQIAGKANAHYRIEKNEIEGRVRTEVKQLGGEERVQELARMLAGEQITETALANARELLAT
jgi:DNA repair protein RecN (Recombination protein N)